MTNGTTDRGRDFAQALGDRDRERAIDAAVRIARWGTFGGDTRERRLRTTRSFWRKLSDVEMHVEAMRLLIEGAHTVIVTPYFETEPALSRKGAYFSRFGPKSNTVEWVMIIHPSFAEELQLQGVCLVPGWLRHSLPDYDESTVEESNDVG